MTNAATDTGSVDTHPAAARACRSGDSQAGREALQGIPARGTVRSACP